MFKAFSQSEIQFNNGGPFYHLHTTPVEDEVVFRNDDEYKAVNNMIAITLTQSKCSLLAYAIMSNHLHFILEAAETNCLLFYDFLKNSLQRYYSRHGRTNIIDKMTPGMTFINNLKQLRDEIVYVIRNPFVIREDVNPLAYQWCSGHLYFNQFINTGGVCANELKTREFRAFVCSRQITEVDGRIRVTDGMANPASFVNYKRAMSFFDSARQFLMNVFKNVEAQVEVAIRYGEMPRLNDDEMLSLSFKICRNLFKVNGPRELDLIKRKQLAVTLKNNYHGSNAQIARCTNLTPKEVDTLFPLAARKK